MDKKILVTRSSMSSLDEYIEEIKDLWDTHWLTNMGPKHKQLQAELKDYMGVENIELLVNGHMAIETDAPGNEFPQRRGSYHNPVHLCVNHTRHRPERAGASVLRYRSGHLYH